jgi:Protein of unknown function (DUF4435)
MLNSARTPMIIANDVSMLRTSMKGAIVLVEGALDVRLYRKFSLPAPHTRTLLCEGKQNLYDTMDIIARRGVPGVIGICDADFDRVLEIPNRANIVRADFHDAETMMIHSESFTHVLSELSRSNINSHEAVELRDRSVGFAAAIGRVRLWNKEVSGRLNFKAVDAGSYATVEGAFDLDGYLRRVLEVSPASSASIADLMQVTEIVYSQVNGQELAVGHDLVAILDTQTAARQSRDRVGTDMLEGMLRLGFDATSFRATDLAREITKWETGSGIEVLVDDASPV